MWRSNDATTDNSQTYILHQRFLHANSRVCSKDRCQLIMIRIKQGSCLSDLKRFKETLEGKPLVQLKHNRFREVFGFKWFSLNVISDLKGLYIISVMGNYFCLRCLLRNLSMMKTIIITWR